MALNKKCNCTKNKFKSSLEKTRTLANYDESYIKNMMAKNTLDYLTLISATFKIDEITENESSLNLINAIENTRKTAENLNEGLQSLSELQLSIKDLNKAITEYIEILSK